MAVTVKEMWWCSPCRRRIAEPRWQNAGRPDAWAYHLPLGGRYAHGITSAPMIEGELVPQREEAMT
jgi:hypothetical protein